MQRVDAVIAAEFRKQRAVRQRQLGWLFKEQFADDGEELRRIGGCVRFDQAGFFLRQAFLQRLEFTPQHLRPARTACGFTQPGCAIGGAALLIQLVANSWITTL